MTDRNPAVLVTGGSSGLGAAVVDAVTKAGGRPYVIDRQPPADGVPWVECDLADTRAAEAATREVIAQAGGSIDGVVTAAGMDVPGALADIPGETWDRIVTIDLLATAAVIRAAIPALKESHGNVVTIASTLGVKAVGDATAYCAAKFGVVGFTRALSARTGRAGRRHAGHPGRHADQVLRRPRRAVQAGPGRDSQRPGQRGQRGDVRAEPAGRLCRPRAGHRRRDGDVVPVILVLRALGVGDLAASVPALRAIRAGFPAETLALAAPAWLTPLIDLIGGVDRVVPTDGLDAAAAGDVEAPEVAINLHGRGPESHRLLRSAGTREAVGVCQPRCRAFRRSDLGRGGARGASLVPFARTLRP